MRASLTFIIFSIFFNAAAFAGNQIYAFGKTEVEFWSFESLKITVSNRCISNSKLADCDALRGLKIVSFKRLDRAKFGGPNPGALICEQQLNGIVMVGIDKLSQNENSFCKLSDGSIVDNGTLISYGIRNDRDADREPNSVKKNNVQKQTKKKN